VQKGKSGRDAARITLHPEESCQLGLSKTSIPKKEKIPSWRGKIMSAAVTAKSLEGVFHAF